MPDILIVKGLGDVTSTIANIRSNVKNMSAIKNIVGKDSKYLQWADYFFSFAIFLVFCHDMDSRKIIYHVIKEEDKDNRESEVWFCFQFLIHTPPYKRYDEKHSKMYGYSLVWLLLNYF